MSDDKNRGLYRKYEVKKLSNPTKEMDCIVLEFDDPLCHRAIAQFAESMFYVDYRKVHDEIMVKLKSNGYKNVLQPKEHHEFREFDIQECSKCGGELVAETHKNCDKDYYYDGDAVFCLSCKACVGTVNAEEEYSGITWTKEFEV